MQEEFESFVSVQKNNGTFLCGGTLLDRDFVLTTASCLTKADSTGYTPEELMVWSDINNVNNDTGKKTVAQVFLHPDFDPVTLNNDIAMLKIDPFAPGHKTETLTAIEPPPSNVTECKVIGWGQGLDGQFLYKIDAKLESDDKCLRAYQGSYTDNQICVSGVNGACLEDSASALMCNDEIVGVLTFGYGCTDTSRPNVFTDVSKYNEWIDDNFRTVPTTTELPKDQSTVTSPSFTVAQREDRTTLENDYTSSTTVPVDSRAEDDVLQSNGTIEESSAPLEG